MVFHLKREADPNPYPPAPIPAQRRAHMQQGGPRIVLSKDPVIRVMIDDSVETDYESLMKEEKERAAAAADSDGDSLKSSIAGGNADSSSLSPPPPLFAAGKQQPPLLTSQVRSFCNART